MPNGSNININSSGSSSGSSSSSGVGGVGGEGLGPIMSQATFEEQVGEIKSCSDEIDRLLKQAMDLGTDPESTNQLLLIIDMLKKSNKKKLAKLRKHVLHGDSSSSSSPPSSPSSTRPDEVSLGGFISIDFNDSDEAVVVGKEKQTTSVSGNAGNKDRVDAVNAVARSFLVTLKLVDEFTKHYKDILTNMPQGVSTATPSGSSSSSSGRSAGGGGGGGGYSTIPSSSTAFDIESAEEQQQRVEGGEEGGEGEELPTATVVDTSTTTRDLYFVPYAFPTPSAVVYSSYFYQPDAPWTAPVQLPYQNGEIVAIGAQLYEVGPPILSYDSFLRNHPRYQNVPSDNNDGIDGGEGAVGAVGEGGGGEDGGNNNNNSNNSNNAYVSSAGVGNSGLGLGSGLGPPAEEAPKPLFSQADKENPLRFLCKLVAYTIALPLYAVWLLISFQWFVPLMNAVEKVALATYNAVSWVCVRVFRITDFICVNTFRVLSIYVINPFYMYIAVPFYRVFILPVLIALEYVFHYLFIVLRWMLIQFMAALEFLFCTLPPIIYDNMIVPLCHFLYHLGVVLYEVTFGFLINYILIPAWKEVVVPFYEKVVVPLAILIVELLVFVFCTAPKFFWEHVCIPLWNCVVYIYEGICAALSWFYESIILPIYEGVVCICSAIWDGIKAVASFIYDYILLPVWNGIVMIYEGVICICTSIWEGIKEVATFIYEYILQPLWQGLVAIYDGIVFIFTSIWNGITAVASFVYENILLPVWNGVVAVVTFIADSIAAIGRFIRDYVVMPFVNLVEAVGKLVYEGLILPIYRFVTAVLTAIADAIRAIARAIGDAISSIARSISSIF